MGIQRLISLIIKNNESTTVSEEAELYTSQGKKEISVGTASEIAHRVDKDGYRKARIITTVEELNSPNLLTDESVGIVCFGSPPHSLISRKNGINYWGSVDAYKPLSSAELFERATINGATPEFAVLELPYDTFPLPGMNSIFPPAAPHVIHAHKKDDQDEEGLDSSLTKGLIPTAKFNTLRDDIEELASELVSGITGIEGDVETEAGDAMRDAIAYRLHRILAQHEQDEL